MDCVWLLREGRERREGEEGERKREGKDRKEQVRENKPCVCVCVLLHPSSFLFLERKNLLPTTFRDLYSLFKAQERCQKSTIKLHNCNRDKETKHEKALKLTRKPPSKVCYFIVHLHSCVLHVSTCIVYYLLSTIKFELVRAGCEYIVYIF